MCPVTCKNATELKISWLKISRYASKNLKFTRTRTCISREIRENINTDNRDMVIIIVAVFIKTREDELADALTTGM